MRNASRHCWLRLGAEPQPLIRDAPNLLAANPYQSDVLFYLLVFVFQEQPGNLLSNTGNEMKRSRKCLKISVLVNWSLRPVPYFANCPKCAFRVPQVCAKLPSSFCRNIPASSTIMNWVGSIRVIRFSSYTTDGYKERLPLWEHSPVSRISSRICPQAFSLDRYVMRQQMCRYTVHSRSYRNRWLNLSWLCGTWHKRQKTRCTDCFVSPRGNRRRLSEQPMSFNGHRWLSRLLSEFYFSQIKSLEESNNYLHLLFGK